MVNNSRARCSSTTLLVFWPLHIFALGVAARTDLAIHDTHFVLYHATLALLEVTLAVLELLGPEIGMQEDPRESPLARANIFSVWTFGWLTPLMKVCCKPRSLHV